MELEELRLCKHMKNVRSSQPCTLMNFCTEFSKAQVLKHGGNNGLLTLCESVNLYCCPPQVCKLCRIWGKNIVTVLQFFPYSTVKVNQKE